MKVALDAMGGDNAPQINLTGAINALRSYPNLSHLFLVGDETILQKEAATHGLDIKDPRVSIVHAPEVIGMAEPGAKSVRRKKLSSISIGMDLVKDGIADAFVSAGNTGAAVAAATLKLRCLKGVDRAGIASPLPNEHGVCNILDAGANPESKPEHLVAYAIMGTAYAKYVLGVKEPRVGLMSNGEEDEKGTTFTKETFKLLKASPINFIGNVEGRDVYSGAADIIVCDGFIGNILLKFGEGLAATVLNLIKNEVRKHPLAVFGKYLLKGAFKELLKKTDPSECGGAPLLGVNGVALISHGGADAKTIKNAVRTAGAFVDGGINRQISDRLRGANAHVIPLGVPA